MNWFGGSIAEAVTLSKQRNAIFVVFVEGENEQSAEMSTTIEDSTVTRRLSNDENFLVVKLKSGSINYTHFAQIYQFVPVPSLFFINRYGTPVEVVCAGVDAQNLATRIDRILENHNQGKPQTVVPSTSNQNVKEQTVYLLQAENVANSNNMANIKPNEPPAVVEPETSSGPAAKIAKTEFREVTRSGQEYEVVCDGDVCVRRLKEKPDVAGPSTKASPTTSATPAADPAPAVPTADPPAATAGAAPPVTIPTADLPTPAPAADPPAAHLPAVSPTADPPAASETASPAPAVTSAVSSDEKVERAKELIDAIRKEKSEKEKEIEKQKELERRALGQSVAELKRWQAEQEMKQIQEERKREKIENDLARQRILEQIAQDRAERRARDLPAPAPQPPHTSQPSPQPPTIVGDGESRARVQFKLADGSTHTGHFDADTTLLELRRYVVSNLQLQQSEFSLWTAFPRQELTEDNSTLRQMRLVPSAAVLVLPRRTPPTVASPSAFTTIFAFLTQLFATIILEPTQQVYAWLRARLFPPAPPAASPAASPAAPPVAPPPPALRRRGNIHRLAGDRNSDDDNNTWNGNSTQQM